MAVHNYRSRQVHETLNGVNPSSGFRDMRSAKSRPNLWQIWQVFGPWASPYGANGQMSMTVHNYRPRQFHRTSNGENPSSGYRDMGSASLAAARPTARPLARPTASPPARTVTTIPLQPGGLRGKKGWQAQTDRQRQTEWQTERQTERQTVKKISIWKCYLQNVGHFFRPKYRLIWCLFFIKVYHQPKLKREIVHISKFQHKILYQSHKKKKKKDYLIHSQLQRSACRIPNENQGCPQQFL